MIVIFDDGGEEPAQPVWVGENRVIICPSGILVVSGDLLNVPNSR